MHKKGCPKTADKTVTVLAEHINCAVGLAKTQMIKRETRMLGSIVLHLFVFQYHTLISNFLSCTNVSCTS